MDLVSESGKGMKRCGVDKVSGCVTEMNQCGVNRVLVSGKGMKPVRGSAPITTTPHPSITTNGIRCSDDVRSVARNRSSLRRVDDESCRPTYKNHVVNDNCDGCVCASELTSQMIHVRL